MTRKRSNTAQTELLGQGVAELPRCTLRALGADVTPVEAQVGVSSLSVGQSEANDVCVKDASVSRFHFELTRDRKGVLIRDLGSTNGTLVEGVFVLEARLSPGQRIRAGRAEFTVALEQTKSRVAAHSEDRFGALIGASDPMRVLFALIDKAAQSDVTVLVQGESGTGKELVAEELHRHSQRREGPFVIVDCGALPEELIESELFGHEKGAFTGAHVERAGAFEAAHGGTLFLDEIGELPLALQPKLLRVLEARTVKRVGSNQRRPVDVRFVAASNRNLRQEVNAGSFREDLFWRLSVVELRIPPLRERADDIPALIEALWQQAGVASGPHPIDADTMAELLRLPWRGNVRELRNYVERTAVLGATPVPEGAPEREHRADDGELRVEWELPYRDAKERWVEHFERAFLEQRMAEAEGNLSRMAREAEMDRAFLLKLLRKHGMR